MLQEQREPRAGPDCLRLKRDGKRVAGLRLPVLSLQPCEVLEPPPSENALEYLFRQHHLPYISSRDICYFATYPSGHNCEALNLYRTAHMAPGVAFLMCSYLKWINLRF